MDTFRYVMAVLILIGLPPGLVYWFIVHPFIGFWRKLGTAASFTVLVIYLLVSMAGLYLIRDAVLVGDYGTSYVLIALAIPFMAVAGYVQWKRSKYLKFLTLAGLPEIDPEKHGGKLLTEGIYGKIRHPRYVEFGLAMVGWSLIVNYLAIYGVLVLTFVLIYPIVILEERELSERFGEAYAEYSARVPRFVPRL